MFQKGQSGNPQGRPRGSKTTVGLPKHAQREVLKQITDRAINGDTSAQDGLLLYMLKEEPCRPES